jgi:predicted HTH domain antitoxin
MSIPNEFYNFLDKGYSVAEAIRQCDIGNRAAAYKAAHDHGWSIDKRKTIDGVKASDRSYQKKSKLTEEEIVHLFEVEKLTLQEIGDIAGVSRERVRQIVKKAGCKPRREENREKREIIKPFLEENKRLKAEAAKAERRQKTYLSNLEKYKELLEMWNAGFTIEEMIEYTGKSQGYIAGTIHRLRVKWGWFERRKSPNKAAC